MTRLPRPGKRFSVITLVILVLTVIVTLFISRSLYRKSESIWETEDKAIKIKGGILTPGVILAEKPKYSQKELVVKGKVEQEMISCQRRDCPKEDPYCSCPDKRNLILFDPGVVLNAKAQGQLRLLDKEGNSFCQRQTNSKEYDCGDWQVGSIYEVGGLFYAEPPPPSWKMSLDYYFTVEAKKLEGGMNVNEMITNLLLEIKDTFASLKSSTYYVLP